MNLLTASTKNIFNFRKQTGDNALSRIIDVNKVITELNILTGVVNNSTQYVSLLGRFSYSAIGNPSVKYSIVAGGSACNHFCGNNPVAGGDPCYNNCNEAACVGCYKTVDGNSVSTITNVISSIQIMAAGQYRITFNHTLFNFVTPGNAVFMPAALENPWQQIGYKKISDYVYDIKTSDLSVTPNALSNFLDNNFIEIRFYKVDINVPFI